jgi:hypothetical protein
MKLTPAPPDPIAGRRPALPPEPVLVEGEEEYVVKEILDSWMFRKKLQYLIKWEGYGVEHNNWEYATEVHAPQCVREFHRKNPAALRFIRAVSFANIPFKHLLWDAAVLKGG